MSTISRQIGWSQESNLLRQILKSLVRLGTITSKINVPAAPGGGSLPNGVLYVNPAGSLEADATYFSYDNVTKNLQVGDAVSGKGIVNTLQQFVLAANGSAFGPTVGNYFGANSAINLSAATTYDIEGFCYFLKTTAGTTTWAPTVSSAATFMHSFYESTPITGFTTSVITGAMVASEATANTITAATHAASGSLTTAVNHLFKFKIRVITNAACNFRLNVTQSAGTITPRAGSFYTVRKVSSNSGTYSA